MELALKDGTKMFIRSYEVSDFHRIQELNEDEGWTNLTKKKEKTKAAWKHSDIAYVATLEDGKLIGYVRGNTDTWVSLFICELLVEKSYRGLGIGKVLLQYVRGLYPDTRVEMLASNSSRSFYENLGFRAFYGFRKTYEE